MFMCVVILETAVLAIIYSYYSLLVQYAVFFRVLLCVIAALVYYAVFFRVRLLLSAYYDSHVPDPGSRLQHRAKHLHVTYVDCTCVIAQCRVFTAVLHGVSVL